MDWIYNVKDPIWETIVGSLMIFIVVIFLTRIVGLRSFAKFTAFDFASTIAIGSVISSILTSNTSIVHGAIAIASLLGLTWLFSVLQRRSPAINKLISNKPILLMEKDKILYDNLKKARIKESQLIAKLREANVLDFSEVEAVVLESTGDISVLHKGDGDLPLNWKLLEDVRRN
ncbi:DUF421 domain-containing protein [Brumimicrobium aurantiacum]|uniref:DUF421 domain-containing protein n=1 Tax=Brumimicrobium aurantiacum TaxID=1737063 RepID=A0A3E1F152_9FLAO|nr:YetF domain-containing protein [Brumimicrobium aurantiacum]RFC55535.1 DUF421 domain-containing protein [Brumimicrobium aurantiacum]